MKITDVRINKLDSEKLKGFADITFDNCFVVKGLKIISGANGLFVSMPSQKDKDGQYHDICFPINKETREMIQTEVLNNYNADDEEEPPIFK